jgi:hypothetical protein
MCFVKTPKPRPAQVAAYDNTEATQQADLEAALRRRRRGAAANILTGASGIPATPTWRRGAGPS